MILFCEYVIPAAVQSAFHSWALERSELWSSSQLLENTGQPGVYVEIWRPRTAEEASEIEKERRNGRSWKEMEQWVKGGADGIRIWTFRSVIGLES
jgi:hypothetical protein